jgi:hypothetical protein
MEAICIYCFFHEVIPRALARGKKLTERPTRGKNNIFDDFHFCHSRVIGLDMTENRIFTLCCMITWVVFLDQQLTDNLLIKFQNILRNTSQVIRHKVKILFSVISSPITLERLKWKSSKMKGLLVKRGGSLSFLTIFTFAVPELLDLIWWKIRFLPYVVR